MSVPLGWCAPTKTVGDAFVSSVWVSGACFTLAALLVLLALAAVFLVALELASNKRRGEWKLRPIASGVLALMCVLESVFFFSFPGDFWRVAGAYYLLATLPGVLVASALYLCSYLFGSIFHDVYFSGLLSDTEIAVRKARRAKTHLFLSVAVAGAQLLLWGLSFALPNATYEQIQGPGGAGGGLACADLAYSRVFGCFGHRIRASIPAVPFLSGAEAKASRATWRSRHLSAPALAGVDRGGAG